MSKRQADSPLDLDFLKRKLKKYQNLIDELSSDKHESDISVRSDDEGSDHDELSESDLEKKTVPKTDSGSKVPRTPQDNDINNSEIIELPEKARDLLGVEKRRQKDLIFEFHPELVASSISREINPDGRKIICEAFKLKGVKEESVSLLLNSITESTLKQYNKPIVDWYYFCKSQDLNLYKPTEGQVADWMSGKFHQGASYSSLNTCRSALSLICGEYIGQSSLLSRLLKGIYKEKPSKPKYNKIYSLDPVINKLEQMSPLSVLSLPELTNKLLMSMALITAHRKQTLSLIKRSNIKKVQNGYEIQIPDFIKTSRRGHHQPLLILPRFPENKNLCVASMLEAYLKVTSD
ncbi:Protein of unknown function, partial [Cotesia congregata]